MFRLDTTFGQKTPPPLDVNQVRTNLKPLNRCAAPPRICHPHTPPQSPVLTCYTPAPTLQQHGSTWDWDWLHGFATDQTELGTLISFRAETASLAHNSENTATGHLDFTQSCILCTKLVRKAFCSPAHITQIGRNNCFQTFAPHTTSKTCAKGCMKSLAIWRSMSRNSLELVVQFSDIKIRGYEKQKGQKKIFNPRHICFVSFCGYETFWHKNWHWAVVARSDYPFQTSTTFLSEWSLLWSWIFFAVVLLSKAGVKAHSGPYSSSEKHETCRNVKKRPKNLFLRIGENESCSESEKGGGRMLLSHQGGRGQGGKMRPKQAAMQTWPNFWLIQDTMCCVQKKSE